MTMEKRTMNLQMMPTEKNKRFDTNYYVEGYAATFEPYVLFYDSEGNPVYEVIEKRAFENADMSEVIMLYDHDSRVFATTSNGTLGFEIDDHGIFVYADLGRTTNSKNLFEDIEAGMITKMSWQFTIDKGGYVWNEAERTYHVTKLRKVYDFSPVSIPANDQTAINARNKFLAQEKQRKEKEGRSEKIKRAKLLIKLSEV